MTTRKMIKELKDLHDKKVNIELGRIRRIKDRQEMTREVMSLFGSYCTPLGKALS